MRPSVARNVKGMIGTKTGNINRNTRKEVGIMKKQEQGEIIIEQMQVGNVSVWIKGLSPLIYNAMSAKVKEGMLTGSTRKSSAEKAASLRHYPIEEYRESVYRREGDGPTRLTFPAVAFKSAAVGAIRHIPNSGTNMTAMRQLMWVMGDKVDVYGVPQLHMAVTKQAGMTGAPDMRTRAILAEWCCCVKLQFVMPILNETTLARLLDAAGLVIGVGDFRQEKGKGNYGQFQIASKEDCEDIIKAGGIKAQDKALENPTFYDTETAELMASYTAERKRRGK